MLWIEVLIPNFKLLVCVVYRPPGTTESFWDNFDYPLEQALNFTENVMERAVYKYTYNFIFEHSLLYAYQSGFIHGHSIAYQLLEMYHRVCQNLDERLSTMTDFGMRNLLRNVWDIG